LNPKEPLMAVRSSDGNEAYKVQAQLAAIVESSDDAIIGMTLDGVITSWNRSAERIFGYRAAKAVGKPITLIIPPERLDEDIAILEKIRRGERIDHFETVRLRKDGSRLDVSLTVSPIRDPDGTIVGISKTSRDITEHKRTAEQLRLATEAGEIGLWDIDVASGRLFWDPRCRTMFGVEPDAPISIDTLYGCVHPLDRDTVTAALAATLEPSVRAPYDVEFRVVDSGDVGTRWIAAKGKGVFDDSGRCLRCVGTAVDITARKRSEIRLRELNEVLEQRMADTLAERKLLADIVESTDAFIQVVDEEFRLMAINRAGADEIERLTGIRPATGMDVRETLGSQPEFQETMTALWNRALAGEAFTAIERLIDPDGEPFYHEMRFDTLRDFDGKKRGVYQFAHDVTKRMLDQARLEEVEDQLRQAQKMEAIGQLAGGIAHDFNNMLAVVMGSLELLDRRVGSSDPRARHYAEAAIDGARRAAVLTQRLLAFSRRQPLQPETLNVNRLVSGMSDLLRRSLGPEIRLETVLAGGLWQIHADPNQLESVILNLGVNARDAMPGGGRLTIETQNAFLDSRYSAKNVGVPAGQYVLIGVSDTGVGMPPDVAEKAFDPFFTTKDVGKGTGLGLSQVYGFVKQSGGHVKIYSEPGQGTTIKIYLPRVVAGSGDEDEVIVPPIMGDEREVILVVDDEQAVRQFSVDALSELGYRVLEADGASSALRALEANPDVALLFTDIAMPETNGRRLADQACALRPGLKVLYTTGYTQNAVVHNGIVDPGVELISKPFTLDDLATRVRSILDRA
jgi:PAS domain S-box-containing protein